MLLFVFSQYLIVVGIIAGLCTCMYDKVRRRRRTNRRHNPIPTGIQRHVDNTQQAARRTFQSICNSLPLIRMQTTNENIYKKIATNCPICTELFQKQEEICILPCDPRHFFHNKCIKEWLKGNDDCPLCREKITEDGIKLSKKYAQMYEIFRQEGLTTVVKETK